jgi:hypothetical protein
MEEGYLEQEKDVDRWKRGTDSRKRMWTDVRGVLTAGKGCGQPCPK